MSERTNIKQIIVIRRDLHMRRGKEVAQGAHASISFLTRRFEELYKKDYYTEYGHDEKIHLSKAEAFWLQDGFKKVTCKVNTEKELLEIYEKAKAAGLEVHLITDCGTTEFHNCLTNTCLAVGPDFDEKIDPITGHLELY